MIKKTLYFGNPAYLSMRDMQLVVKMPEIVKADLPDIFNNFTTKTIPIEDIGVVILDNKQITITHGVIEALLDNNTSIIVCNSSRMPFGLMLPLDSNSIQSERYTHQINASLPLKKQLWQQTIQTKIVNQAAILEKIGVLAKSMRIWSNNVKSGDTDNMEARAAAYYWKNIFSQVPNFYRDRNGPYPNNLLNYGYAILRAIIARALVSSGLLPTLGIHHHNKYNAYCLADDIMEPYRPYVDNLVLDIILQDENCNELSVNIKSKLLSIPVLDVEINGERRPLMNAASITTASLVRCYTGEARKIIYPLI